MDNAPAAPLCTHGNCTRTRGYASGLCRRHEYRSRRGLDMDAPGERDVEARPIRTPSPAGNCSVSLCLLRLHHKGLCERHYRRWRQAVKEGTADTGEWKRLVKEYRRRGDARAVKGNVSRRTRSALRTQSRADGVTFHAMVGKALDEWARRWQLQRSEPDECDVSRDVVARPDAWSQRPDFTPDNDSE